MNIIDAAKDVLSAFENDRFNLEKWKSYMEINVPQAKEICLLDMEDSISAAGLSWEEDYLPVLNAVVRHPDQCDQITESFCRVTENLNQRILDRFGKAPDADIILYLGLCNGAGWVTTLSGRTTVLLGIEKILELDWCGLDAMNGLILHELGHVYQAQYGILHREIGTLPDQFLWQLFTEGIAMVFEQEIVGDPEYYHQDKAGWKDYCAQNLQFIGQSFIHDLDTMTRDSQRYFGDWADFHGYGDVGYYLGAHFVRFLLAYDCFDDLILYDMDNVRKGFRMFSEYSIISERNEICRSGSMEKLP